jgi:hypothetical protein
MSNFHATSLQVKSYSYFPKLNDGVWNIANIIPGNWFIFKFQKIVIILGNLGHFRHSFIL